jgi:ABC-type dipeptide/oligopeptide/nickel transport system permease component
MRFLFLRLIEAAGVAWAVATIAFFALRIGRVDPSAVLLSQGLASREQAEEIRASLGLDLPLHIQYSEYLSGAACGDFGNSIFSGQSAAAMVAEALVQTAPLALTAWVLSILTGLALGVVASHRGERGWIGRAGGWIGAMLAAGAAAPVAWTGLILLWVSVPLVAASAGGFRDLLRLLLPAAALAFTVGCSIGRVAETAIRRSRSESFALAMRAHGFPVGWRADMRLLRSAIAPLLAFSALEGAFLLGGTLVTEAVFARAGMGRLLVDAILQGDFPVVQLALPVVALGYTFFGLAADFASAALDPRMRELR